jgi:hypothetical protein
MIPGAETTVLGGLDHMAPLTHPAELGRAIAGHVRRHGAAPSG